MKNSLLIVVAALTFAVAAAPARDASAATDCIVEFNNWSSLNNIPQQARATFGVFPWYLQTCGPTGKQMNFIPVYGYEHYHLTFEDTSLGACFINGGFGRLVNGVCQQPDWASENRIVIPHDSGAPVCFYPTNGLFDVGHFWIKGSVNTLVSYQDQYGGWWEWSSLAPGFYYLNVDRIQQMCFRAANGQGSPTSVDWIEIQNL